MILGKNMDMKGEKGGICGFETQTRVQLNWALLLKKSSQPHSKRKFGLFEKHKDYVERERTYRQKEQALQILQARRSFQALKGLVRLVGVVRGQSVLEFSGNIYDGIQTMFIFFLPKQLMSRPVSRLKQLRQMMHQPSLTLDWRQLLRECWTSMQK